MSGVAYATLTFFNLKNIVMILIRNHHEKVCIQYTQKYITRYKNLYMMPVEQLKTYTNLWNEVLIIQPPYIDNAGNVRYNDWSISCKRLGINNRYEISSLDVPNSEISSKAYRHALESVNIPEDKLFLILLGKGYDRVMEQLNILIKKGYPITVMRSIEEYKEHIDKLFCNY